MTPDAEGNNAFRFTHQVYDFLFNSFHRHSWDGREGTTRVILDEAGNVANAAYVHICNQFVFGNNMSTLDILAHEVTHGITASSANLIYRDQPGALNESYSDVMAAMIDTANWTIGEGSLIGTFRSLSNPGLFRDFDPIARVNRVHPDHMNQFHVMTFDDGGAHINSGIPNKAAFLIAAGGTHNGITVRGIGRTRTAALITMS